MHMKKTLVSLTAVLTFLIGATALVAHGDMVHVMGTVAAISDTEITVDTVKHTKETVMLDSSTKFNKSNAEASLKDLKVGDRVVIHAKEDKSHKLIAAEVKWGTGSMKMDNMKDMPAMDGTDHKH